MFLNALAVAGLIWFVLDVAMTVVANKNAFIYTYTLSTAAMLSGVVGGLWLVFG